MAFGGWGGSTPMLQDLFVKNIGKVYAYDFLPLKFYWITLKKNALVSEGSCHVTSSRQGVNENLQFWRVLEHISETFQYLFIKYPW